MILKNKETRKQLSSQLQKIEGEMEALGVEISAKQQFLRTKQSHRDDLVKKIKQLDRSENIMVSEHAIIRYFERILGYNIQTIKETILSKSFLEIFSKVSCNGTYPSGEFRVIIKDNTIVSIIKDN